MKLTLITLCLCISSTFATEAFSQSVKVTISAKYIQAQKVIDQIETQTDYLFVYNNKQVNLNQYISIDAKDETLASVLQELTNQTAINYVMEGNTIILTNKNIAKIAQQSQKKINGTIVDVKGQSIIGANIIIQGTTNGTITDLDGKFVLEVPQNATINISYLGYIEKTIKVSGK